MSENNNFSERLNNGYIIISDAIADAKSQYPNSVKSKIKLVSYRLNEMRNSCTLTLSVNGYEQNYSLWLSNYDFDDVELYINFSRTTSMFSDILA